MGVLFRKGDALQMLQEARVVALDKTGTLTQGRPELTDLIAADGFDSDEVLRLVAAIEAQSEHPIAEAITRAATQRGLGWRRGHSLYVDHRIRRRGDRWRSPHSCR